MNQALQIQVVTQSGNIIYAENRLEISNTCFVFDVRQAIEDKIETKDKTNMDGYSPRWAKMSMTF
ncbi:MAG: hypothetical protein R3A45_11760 [Bdellovibrionota bacterium]